MHLSNSLGVSGVILAAKLAAADVNYAAKGACDSTQGGASPCGPNGSEKWLNRGIDGDGWEPPFLDVNSLEHISLEEYYNGIGSDCEPYDQYFQSSGQKYNIDPAILAFIAMLESSCNPDAGSGTPGLMQCDPSNCQNGESSCKYPVGDNVDCGAFVLREKLDTTNGNIVHALGSYNGWFTASDDSGLNGGKGLTEGYPCSKEGQGNGAPQNLDYLHDGLNGVFQGIDIYDDEWKVGGIYHCTQDCSDGGVC